MRRLRIPVLRARVLADFSRAQASLRRDIQHACFRIDRSTAVATALSPYLGYAKTAELAKASVQSGRSIRELVLEQGLMDPRQLDRVLSAEGMTQPGIVGQGSKP